MTTVTTDDELAVAAAGYLTDPAARVDPWELLARLRAQRPVLRTATGVWLVTGYPEVVAVLRTDRLLSRRTAGQQHVIVTDPEAKRVFTSRMLYTDRPEHGRLRGLVSHAFTPAAVDVWRERIRAIATDHLDQLLPHGRADLVHDYAYPVVEQVITDIIGLPHGDLDKFLRWSAVMVEGPPGTSTPETVRAATAATHEAIEYVRARAAEHAVGASGDLLSRLLAAEASGDGRLAEHELVALTFELIFAGYETTSNFVPNAVLTLLRHPNQLAALRGDRTRLPTAVDELLRYETSLPMAMPRVAIADVVIGGHTVRTGETVVAVVAAANRDPQMFDRPDELVLDRDPNPLIAFGFGAHYCLGHALARLESIELLNALLDRLPDLTLAGTPGWSLHQYFRCLETLDVTWSSGGVEPTPQARTQ